MHTSSTEKMPITQEEARRITKELVQHIYNTLDDETGITPKEVIKGGSLGQGTAVNGEFDLDLVIITEAITLEEIKGNDGAADYSFWLRKLECYVHKTMPDRCTDIRVTKMAVIFQYQGEIEVDLLISPHIVDPHEFYRFLGLIPPEHHSSYTVCTNKWQVEFISKQTNTVKDLIRKAKMWRNLIYRDTHRARPKSYLMALLVIAAHEQAGSAEASAVTRELKKLVANNQSVDVHWNKYYTITHSGSGVPLPPHCATAPRILDPANPFYNVYSEGFSYTRNPCSEWEKVTGNIDTLDLVTPDGMRIGPNRLN